ncbi:MAG: mandelate racemase/muconate lactonizing enzyme family protein [Pseudomonadota bacterium]
MSTIDRIEITQHRMTLDPPFKASWDGRLREFFDATIVRVTDKDGVVGIGSGDLMLGFEGHEDLFIGQRADDHERHYTVLDHIQFHYGRCWPLDLALWDLHGKQTGTPVWNLLGGRSGDMPLYASSGVAWDTGELVEQAEFFAEEGFPAMKIRLSSTKGCRADWRADITALEAVRSRVGDRLDLMVDCNQGWRMPWDTSDPWSVDQAIEVARALEPLRPFWMEEPLHRADRSGMRALREATSIRIAGGEMTRDVQEFDDLIADDCLDVYQADVALVGGITGCARIARKAVQAGRIYTPHSWTNGAGVLANAHLTAGCTNAPFLEFPFDPPQWSLAHRDYMLAQPAASEGGVLKLGEAPGLGIELDEERLKATRIS